MNDSRELSRQECVDLLAAGTVARVAVTTPDGPHIVPVSYSVHGDAVVVRTSAYSLLGTYARDAVVALEIDGFVPRSSSGWSVVLRGRCSVETDPRAIREILSASAGGPWAGGTRNLFLRLRTDQVSGRAVGDLTPAATQQVLESLESRSSGSTDAFFGA
jgi:nitroimidazol reductase NimA-like FMN-containing flavoprotein (pyridoxamine 5'-phosphate oxidase superfamily)